MHARTEAGIPADAMVLGYLGSVGRMYMLDRFFRLLELASAERDDIHALMITRDTEALKKIMFEVLPRSLHTRVCIRSARREEVPQMLAAMDVMASFVLPSHARISTSPTKLAECFAVGIPAICNPGVGDVEMQMNTLDAGWLVDPGDDDALRVIAGKLNEICKMGGVRLRTAARLQLGLEVARTRYAQVYSNLNLRNSAPC